MLKFDQYDLSVHREQFHLFENLFVYYFFLLKPHIHKTIDGLIFTFKRIHIYGLNWQ